jgi:hypothetical protein
MKLRSALAAAALALASLGATAVPVFVPFDSGGNAAFFNTSPGSPTFTDLFSFTVPDLVDLSGSLTSSFSATKDVDITSITISNGSGPIYSFFKSSADPFEQWILSGATLFKDINYTLTVVGLQSGTVAGGYSGEMSVTAIPEPETYALFLAGLAAMGYVARRRRPRDI